MEAQWLVAGAVPFLPFYGPADVDTELIHTRHSALLPFIAVHHCLTPMSMWQLWTTLGQPLLDGGREVEMGVLLDWIWVASISSAPQVAPTIQLAAHPPALLADAGLLGYLNCFIWWLPGLGMPAIALQVALPAPQVLGIMQKFVDDHQTRHQAKDSWQAAVAQKTPAQCWNPQSMAVLQAAK